MLNDRGLGKLRMAGMDIGTGIIMDEGANGYSLVIIARTALEWSQSITGWRSIDFRKTILRSKENV